LVKGIKLIVGLGNPGQRYLNTRHNVGFSLVQLLAQEHQVGLKAIAKFQSLGGELILEDQKSFLLLPQTFMNLSGVAVHKAAKYYAIAPEEVLVVHDELDFVPGIARLKFSGGANGHNGVQSIIDHLGSRDFWRLRIGIGRPIVKDAMSDYVLTAPRAEELEQINHALLAAAAIIPRLMVGDFDRAIAQLHS
jgi:PTH1 family peptidyl-tRNA hydrolase